MKVRVVKEGGGFLVQTKRCYWPFWINCNWFSYKETALENAQDIANPESVIVWSSDSPETAPCK